MCVMQTNSGHVVIPRTWRLKKRTKLDISLIISLGVQPTMQLNATLSTEKSGTSIMAVSPLGLKDAFDINTYCIIPW